MTSQRYSFARGTSSALGVFGLLAFLYLAARITVYSVEANVVLAQRLWPRSLTKSQLSPADKRQMVDLARRARTGEHEKVTVEV